MIAHIDTGINSYHEIFRDTSPLADVHPSKYIPGYPEDTPALRLSLDERNWKAAFEKDRAIWEGLLKEWEDRKEGEPPKMYWVPGTKISGAVRFEPGGTNSTVGDAPPLSHVDDPSADCRDWPILDDHGHGTMTATRMAGNRGSLCPQCRIVSIEGLGWDQVKWAADQGWIDVQTNFSGSSCRSRSSGPTTGSRSCRRDLQRRQADHRPAGDGDLGHLRGRTPRLRVRGRTVARASAAGLRGAS